nr:F-box/kelch-repeat protein At3g23880-like [Ipomoea trifida]
MVRHQLKLHRPNAKRGKNFNIPYALGYMVVNNNNLKLMVHVDGWYTRLTGRTALKTVVVDRLVASQLQKSSFTDQSRLVKQAKGVHITSYRITKNIRDIKIFTPFTIRPMELQLMPNHH